VRGFITFEGIEGSGKTTQIGLLHGALLTRGVDAVLTREPGGTPTGDRIRTLLLDSASVMSAPTELLLYAAARAEHLETLIRPALAAGRTVLCDRFTDATYAYQGYGRGLPLGLIDAIHALPVLATVPDRTVLIDLDPGVALQRARRREASKAVDESRFEREAAAFHERVRRGYLELAKRAPARFAVVDGSGGPETVHRRVMEALCAS
jgi:dTMP kinase